MLMSFLRNKTRESNTTIGHARPICSSNKPATPMLPPERGLDFSYESARCWVLKFGPHDRAEPAAAPPAP